MEKIGKQPQIRETENGKEKWCSKGKHYAPADLEHFYRDSRSSTGLTSQCRKCQKVTSADAIVRKNKSNPEARPTPVTQRPQAKNDKVSYLPVSEEKDMVLHLDFSEYEILFGDLLIEAKEQLRTPAMQAMWIVSESIYKERSAAQ